MSAIEFELARGAINVDATAIAEGLWLEPAQAINSLRNGELTALCEQGIAGDAGRYRLTFFYEGYGCVGANQQRMALNEFAAADVKA